MAVRKGAGAALLTHAGALGSLQGSDSRKAAGPRALPASYGQSLLVLPLRFSPEHRTLHPSY